MASEELARSDFDPIAIASCSFWELKEACGMVGTQSGNKATTKSGGGGKKSAKAVDTKQSSILRWFGAGEGPDDVFKRGSQDQTPDTDSIYP